MKGISAPEVNSFQLREFVAGGCGGHRAPVPSITS